MSAQEVEAVLARLYADREFCALFLADSKAALQPYSLEEDERRGLESLDRPGLVFACRSFARKRDRRKPVSGILQKMARYARTLWPFPFS
jgi:hypothetical protein